MKSETNPIANKLKRRYGKVMPFAALPIEAKLAVAHYMAVDGEAWEQPPAAKKKNGQYRRMGKQLNSLLEANMDFFDANYGKKKFGLALVPREEFEASLFANFKKNPDTSHLATVDGWKKEYAEGGPTVNHTNFNWPVILSSFKDELLQDGWHRMHCYLTKKVPVIPCLYYIHS